MMLSQHMSANANDNVCNDTVMTIHLGANVDQKYSFFAKTDTAASGIRRQGRASSMAEKETIMET